MMSLLIVLLMMLVVLHGLLALLRHIRDDQAAKIVEHWRKNGIP